MKLKLFSVIFFVLFFFSAVITAPSVLAEVTISSQKVEYALPHPGMIPDNPLYFFKKIRDGALIFFTRDYQKKADMYLLFSDKKIVMARLLLEKGKGKLSAATASAAEKNAQQALESAKKAKRQGSSPSAGFIHTIKVSTQKHRELLEGFLGKSSRGDRPQFEEALELNRKIGAEVLTL